MAQARGDAGLNEEKVAVVRQMLEKWNKGDVDGLLEAATDDLEWLPVLAGAVEGEAFHGHDGFRRFSDGWDQTWEKWELEIQELRPIGDQVVALTRVEAKGRGSGVEFDQPIAQLLEFRGDLVCRGETFLDQEQALATAEQRAEKARQT